jgi:hypothetical protein
MDILHRHRTLTRRKARHSRSSTRTNKCTRTTPTADLLREDLLQDIPKAPLLDLPLGMHLLEETPTRTTR